MSSIALGAAFAAVQLVHQAHSKVKTSKARCARLVERCQLVVDRLERIAETKGSDAIIRERIHELERAFEHTARTIAQVGQQGIIASLLRSESNALRIESCNDTLTELITLFNLEGMVDVRRWQSDLEAARVRDHRELLSLGRRIEGENAAINRELAQQGATITEVLRVIHDINAGLENARVTSGTGTGTVKIAMPLSQTSGACSRQTPTINFGRNNSRSTLQRCVTVRPAHTAAAATPLPLPAMRTSKMVESDSDISKSPVSCTSSCPTSPRSMAAASGTRLKSATRTARGRRLSESLTKKCVKMGPLANFFSKLSSSHPLPYSSPLPMHGVAAPSGSSNFLCGRSPVLETVSSAICGSDEGVRNSVSSSSWFHLLMEPPPPYQLRVANPGPEHGYPPLEDSNADCDIGYPAAPTSSSRFTTASVEAIRAPDSPVPVFPSPKLSTESVFGSTQSLASVSSGRSGASPAPRRRTPRNTADGPTGPVLRRRDTIRFARLRVMAMSSGHSSVEPIIRPLGP